MKKQYLRQGTVAVNWLQLYRLDFPSILASDATDELTKVSTQLLYGDFRSLSDPQYHAYCYAALQALQMYGQYLAGIYHEQAEKLTEAQNFYLKAEAAPETLKKRLEEYQAENKHLKEVVRNITQMNASLLKRFVYLRDQFNSVVPLLQMLPKCRCGKTFISKDTLLHHMKISHPHWPIPPEYEERYFSTSQRPKRTTKARLVESARNYQHSDSDDNDETDDESQNSDLEPIKKVKTSHRTSKRSKQQTHLAASPAPRSYSSSSKFNSMHGKNLENPYEPPRSYSSHVPQSQVINTRFDNSSVLPAAHAVSYPKENGQVQYIISRDTLPGQAVASESIHNNPNNADIEALIERAIARSLSAYKTTCQPTSYAANDNQKGAPLPLPPVMASYGPPYLGSQVGEQQTLVYQPEDYEICPTSKTELKSPIGFRQAAEPTTDITRTAHIENSPKAASSVKPPLYTSVPNYVSSQLGSESLQSLHERDPFLGQANVSLQHQMDSVSNAMPSNPTILQATAPVVTLNPSATFVHPPDNIISPLCINQQVDQSNQGPQAHAPVVSNQISRESTLFAEDPEPQPDTSATENIGRINDTLTEHVRENWPELFQKPEALPYNLDLTEPEILRRISVLNRSINNAVAANNLMHSSLSGYHSSLSTYEEYGSTINDLSHRL
ncbi:Hypothetical protein GLP15_2230 [Giardia lamblia P15]|uniref:Uncharacterized protein n=1 Tax=Giardia intestinalis (strain P15) TaxID=658858 RepID=E1F757_GIAIA|nr:Hypothetical protein GLP15_2230 [Giardia lamblia P15]